MVNYPDGTEGDNASEQHAGRVLTRTTIKAAKSERHSCTAAL